MKDELWMRTWNDGHPRFSDDLHHGLLWLIAVLRRLAARLRHPSTAKISPLPLSGRDVV